MATRAPVTSWDLYLVWRERMMARRAPWLAVWTVKWFAFGKGR